MRRDKRPVTMKSSRLQGINMKRQRTGQPPAEDGRRPVRRGSDTHRLLEIVAQAAAQKQGGEKQPTAELLRQTKSRGPRGEGKSCPRERRSPW